MAKTHVKFITEINSMYVSITPDVQGFLAIPTAPTVAADAISDAVEKADPDIRCENAMYHSFAFTFLVTIRENETPAQARSRTLRVFTDAWGNIVEEVKKGRSLNA